MGTLVRNMLKLELLKYCKTASKVCYFELSPLFNQFVPYAPGKEKVHWKQMG